MAQAIRQMATEAQHDDKAVVNSFCETTASARLWLYLKRLYFISSVQHIAFRRMPASMLGFLVILLSSLMYFGDILICVTLRSARLHDVIIVSSVARNLYWWGAFRLGPSLKDGFGGVPRTFFSSQSSGLNFRCILSVIYHRLLRNFGAPRCYPVKCDRILHMLINFSSLLTLFSKRGSAVLPWKCVRILPIC